MHAGAKKGNGNGTKLVAEAIEAAEEAGLRYVSDDRPGYTRKTKGDNFEYFDTEQKPITDEQRLLRIKRLAIPPAWTDVWVCPAPNCHIQSTGRDARGRKQYLYHERWREIRDENKYDRMISFGKALPKIRRRIAKDLKLPGLPRNKVLATVVQLLERTFIRIGNEEYARDNKSFGLTTMKDRHVEVKGSKLRFRFRGKSGKDHEVDVSDRRIARIVSKLQDLPGQDLFKYVDDSGEVRDITSQDVNEYLREITGDDFSAKDFRTLAGTVLTAVALNAQEKFENNKQAKANIKSAIGAVSKILGNTPAICRKCYVHPEIFDSYLSRRSIDGLKQMTEEALEKEDIDLRSSEAAVLKFLESRLAKKAA
ncbi:MAG TPA: DNA topoisomerase IB [Chthoniobacterales bacterium]|nr:DNA topoisomerase IB [Chthoniobacterales bacterium]